MPHPFLEHIELDTLFNGVNVRHTLATELLGRGASFEEMADILGNSPEIVRKHYGKWSVARQLRIGDLIQRVYIRDDQRVIAKSKRVQ